MKQALIAIISFFTIFAHTLYAQTENVEVSIKFHDKTMYYPGNTDENPVYVHVSIINKGTETYRFKLADDRIFSLDFTATNVKNTKLSPTQNLIRKRTTSKTVYFREIALAQDEEYSFVENIKDYLEITDPSIYYVKAVFYPDLYKNPGSKLTSNRLSLEIRPSPSVSSSVTLPVSSESSALLQPEQIGPDKVVEQTIIARQRSLWDQFFLYMDLEEMLKRDPVRRRKFNSLSASGRADMIEAFRADLMQERIDRDIVSIPAKFEIKNTTYSQNEGYVIVQEWFKNETFYEVKEFTYYVRQRNGIWQIYDYTVVNLSTE